MSTTVLAVTGIAAGVVNTVGLVPYIRDVFRHKTKPERATWWVWLALASLAFYAQWQAGATWSLIMTGAGIVACGLLAVLSLRYGYGRFHLRDTVSLVVAAVGIVIAQYIQSPLFALLVIIGVDIIGLWLTLYKSWLAPHTETLISWFLATVSGGLAALAVGEWNFTQLIYPAYLFVGNGLIVLVIVYRRRKQRPSRSTS